MQNQWGALIYYFSQPGTCTKEYSNIFIEVDIKDIEAGHELGWNNEMV